MFERGYSRGRYRRRKKSVYKHKGIPDFYRYPVTGRSSRRSQAVYGESWFDKQRRNRQRQNVERINRILANQRSRDNGTRGGFSEQRRSFQPNRSPSIVDYARRMRNEDYDELDDRIINSVEAKRSEAPVVSAKGLYDIFDDSDVE